MNPDLIRRIDYFLGIPVCAALSAHRALMPGNDAAAPPPRRVLFIKMTEQGATVLAARAIDEVASRVGRENVFFWTFAENRQIVDLLSLLPKENVITVRSKHPALFALDMVTALRKVRALGIDATVDIEFFTRAPAALAYLTGAKRRAGLHRFTAEAPYRGDLLTHRVHYNPYLHTSRMFEVVARSLFESPQVTPHAKSTVEESRPLPPAIPATPEDMDYVARTLGLEAGRHRPLVLLNANASDLLPLRRWDSSRFVSLARRILDEWPEALIAFTGAPDEQAAIDALVATVGHERAASMAGRTTLPQLLALYHLADVLVTNDSGPAHFASMTGIHAITLFGPETPKLYGPLGRNSRVITAGLACSPCVSVFNHRFSPCTDNVCMQAISVDRVFDEIRSCLDERSRQNDESPRLLTRAFEG